MTAISARFDGKVFVPDEAVDLPQNQRVVVHVAPIMPETVAPSGKPPGKPAADFEQFVGSIDPADLKLMSEAIEEAFEKVEPDEW
jgi:hypothetical protein